MIKTALQHYILDFGIKYIMDKHTTEFTENKYITFKDLNKKLFFRELTFFGGGLLERSNNLGAISPTGKIKINKISIVPYEYYSKCCYTKWTIPNEYYVCTQLDNGRQWFSVFRYDCFAILK